MPGMDWILSALIGYLLKALGGLGSSVEWVKIKAEAHSLLAPFVPDFLEPAVFSLVDSSLDVVASALSSTDDLSSIIAKVVAKDYKGALDQLIELLKKSANPHAVGLAAACENYKAQC